MKPLCIFHGGCDDGFASAYVVHRAFEGEIDFHAGVYQVDPPDVHGRHVVMVDFSYKLPVLEQMARQARSITILDHHKSAAADLEHFANPTDMQESFDSFADMSEFGGYLPIRAIFDMNRSGAGITWDYFFPKADRPWLIEYVQDRDLWRRQLPNCDEIIMALRSYPQDFDVWGAIIERGADALLSEGIAIHRYYRTIVDALKRNAVRQTIGGVSVPVVNSPYHFASELAGELAEGEPFAACYWNHAHGTTYSLRSRSDGMDVSEIATQYGGGGHRGAAGFKVPRPL